MNDCCTQPSSHRSRLYGDAGTTSTSRRSFISEIAAIGWGALACGSVACPRSVFAQAAAGVKRRLIDVHHHFVPDFYRVEYRQRIAGVRGGQLSEPWLKSTPPDLLAAIDRHGVQISVLSLSTPGVWFGDATESRTLVNSAEAA